MIDIIIPMAKFHEGSYLHRMQALDHVIPFYMNCSMVNKIIIVFQKLEHDQISRIDFHTNKISHIQVEYPYFSKGWLYNIGAMESNAEFLCFTESDMCPPDSEYFARVYNWMRIHYLRYALGWNALLYTNESQRDIILDQIQGSSYKPVITLPTINEREKNDHGRRNLRTVNDKDSTNGGYLFCERESFYELGMYNETFFGLGGIDNEIWERITRTTGIYAHALEMVYHLYHPVCTKKAATRKTEIPNLKKVRITRKYPHEVNKWCNSHCRGDLSTPCEEIFPIRFAIT